MLPWEKYSTQESLPWEKYAQPEQEEPQETLEQRKARIASYENPHPQHVGWTGQDAIDIVGAMLQSPERVLDGATLGYYSKYNREHGGTYDKRKQWLNDLAREGDAETANAINNFVLDVGGDIKGLGGLLFKGLSKSLKGAKLMASASGADGTIRGWNQGDDTFNSAVNAMISGIGGAATGGILHYGLAGLGKAYNFLRSGGRDAYKKGVDYLKNTFGDEATNAMIKEAEESGRSLAEVVDDSGVQLLQTARQQTPEARNIITKNIEEINENAPNKTRQLVDDTFGGKDRLATIDELEAQAKREAAPLWKKLNNMGDLAQIEAKNMPTAEEQAQQNFKRWFEGSKVVDENGQPLKLYHGTNANFDAFEHGYNRIRPDANGFFFTPRRDMAETYAKGVVDDAKDQYIKEVYLNVKNPYKANNYNEIAKADSKFINQLKKEGYDGIVYKPTEADGVYKPYREEYLAFEPNQIKSVNNSGAWSSSPSLSDAGWKPNTQTPLQKVIADSPYLQQEIAKVKNTPLYQTEYQMAKLLDTDFRVLQAVKENIDDQINVAKRQGEDKLVRRLTMQKNELLNRMDEVVPEYKQARQIYEDEKQFERAVNLAQDVFKTNVDAPKFAKRIDELGKQEREALKIGLRDEVLKVIGNAENENVSFKKLLPANAQAKIRKVMGAKEGDKLINYARQEVIKMRNFNKLLSGSQTAEKTALQKASDLIRKPIDVASGLVNRDRNLAIARTMTTPDIQAVSNAYSQVTNPVGNESLYQYLVNPDPVRASLAAYLANKF